jgi:hypothetical protein
LVTREVVMKAHDVFGHRHGARHSDSCRERHSPRQVACRSEFG